MITQIYYNNIEVHFICSHVDRTDFY